MSISVVINTRNEQENLPRAIKSVKNFADEVVVVDMESEDGTVKKAKSLGATVYAHKKTNYVEPARNYAIEKAKSEWILILDADEEASPELLSKLGEVAKENTYSFVRVPRKNIIFGKWMKHARWWPDENIRFFKKGSVTWENEIHSIPITVGEGLTLPSEENLSIRHHNYQTIEQYIDRLNRYSTVQAKELHKKGKAVQVTDFIDRPTSEFLSRYFAGQGYKDGLHGLVISLLQALSEAVVYAKLWQLSDFEEKKVTLKDVSVTIASTQKEINYWKAHALVEQGAGVTEKIKRKFKLS